MQIEIGNLWEVKADFRGITTNGNVTKSGNAIMCKGVALQAKKKFVDIEKELGLIILAGGNRLHLLNPNLFSFPTKYNWRDRSSLNLIRQSVAELKGLAERIPDRIFAIPLPGTENGGRKPHEIWPLLQDLPDNVKVVVLTSNMLPEKNYGN